jgi:hypothetical protein
MYGGCNTKERNTGNNDANARIHPLYSPYQGGSNGGQIIKIC